MEAMNNGILERIRKLLKLADQNANIHEAANAAGQAQKLMERFRIDQASLDLTEGSDEAKDEPIEDDILSGDEGAALATWRWQVAHALCITNGCIGYVSGNSEKKYVNSQWVGTKRCKSIKIVGRGRDASVVRYMYQYLTREIERLTQSASEERGRPGRTWINSFRRGAATEVSKRLKEANTLAQIEARTEATNGTALAVVNKAIARITDRHRDARRYANKHLHLRSGSNSASNIDRGAYERGQMAGSTISLSSGPSLGSGHSGALKQ